VVNVVKPSSLPIAAMQLLVTKPRNLVTLSSVEIEDDQLGPVVWAIQMPRVNLLIAADVGLGKTIEAGMVGLELMIHHRARKILVVCPFALQIPWQDPLRAKSGLDFRIIDSSPMRELRLHRGIHVNP